MWKRGIHHHVTMFSLQLLGFQTEPLRICHFFHPTWRQIQGSHFAFQHLHKVNVGILKHADLPEAGLVAGCQQKQVSILHQDIPRLMMKVENSYVSLMEFMSIYIHTIIYVCYDYELCEIGKKMESPKVDQQ